MTAIHSRFNNAVANPFLEELDAVLTDPQLEERLQYSPLDGIDSKRLSKGARHDLLDRMQHELFVPSLTAIDITSRLYRMIRKGYLSRDPTHVQTRATSMVISRLAGAELRNVPWLPNFAHGMRIVGITGLGKTYEARRAIEQLPHRIEHGRCESADWTHFYQAPFLYVGMSHDGSLGGLLLQILVALDAAIYTDYSSQRRITSLSHEKLAVQVGIILANHAVGVLIIDEIQLSNFNDGARGTLARTFFLRLLNFGIPILLIGNPLGMQVLNSFSQDVRRLGSSGTVEMHPIEVNHSNYVKVLAPAFWSYNVLPAPPDIQDPCGEILFRYCGGIRDYACRVLIAAQRIALDLDETSISQEHLDLAFNGPDFSDEDRAIILAFNTKNAELLSPFEDIPWEAYLTRWRNGNDASRPSRPEQTASASSEPERSRKTFAQQSAQNIAAKRTKSGNQDARIKRTKSGLSKEDLRADGIKEHLIAGLTEACTSTNQKR